MEEPRLNKTLFLKAAYDRKYLLFVSSTPLALPEGHLAVQILSRVLLLLTLRLLHVMQVDSLPPPSSPIIREDSRK